MIGSLTLLPEGGGNKLADCGLEPYLPLTLYPLSLAPLNIPSRSLPHIPSLPPLGGRVGVGGRQDYEQSL